MPKRLAKVLQSEHSLPIDSSLKEGLEWIQAMPLLYICQLCKFFMMLAVAWTQFDAQCRLRECCKGLLYQTATTTTPIATGVILTKTTIPHVVHDTS